MLCCIPFTVQAGSWQPGSGRALSELKILNYASKNPKSPIMRFANIQKNNRNDHKPKFLSLCRCLSFFDSLEAWKKDLCRKSAKNIEKNPRKHESLGVFNYFL